MKPWPLVALLAFVAVPAKADRPVTEAERTQLRQAVAAQGCRDGKMEWDEDDREFEVDNAVCEDGRRYDLKFDAEFRLKSKQPDR